MSTERPDHARPGDASVDGAWRAASTEEPGLDIDAAILAAARAEVERARPRPVADETALGLERTPRVRRSWTSWQPLAAAASVAGLAFVLLQMIPRDRNVAPPVSLERARPEAAQVPAESQEMAAPVESRDLPAAPLAVEAGRGDEPPARRTPAPPLSQPAVSAAPAKAPSRASAEAPAGIAAQAERELGESPRAESAAADAASPEAWALRVEDLFDAGDRVAAAAELRAFRAAHAEADRYLPEALRDWAATVE